MIITRTPLRVPLGGGGTDLPGFYQNHGGFIFSATIDKFMYVTVNRPSLDSFIHIKYSESEKAGSVDQIRHPLAREALRYMGITERIEITSFADIPGGTGLGSSSSYLVGLLKALHLLQGSDASPETLAHEACHIEMEVLKSPVGKQDQYLAAYGGFLEMEIGRSGSVAVRRASISPAVITELEEKVGMYFTNKFHRSSDILTGQNKLAAAPASQVERSMLKIKDIGRRIKAEMEQGNIAHLGLMMHEHWEEKKKMSDKISDPELDRVYSLALRNGADGGKIMGSGGGGLFLFFCPDGKSRLSNVLAKEGYRELPFHFHASGSRGEPDVFGENQTVGM